MSKMYPLHIKVNIYENIVRPKFDINLIYTQLLIFEINI